MKKLKCLDLDHEKKVKDLDREKNVHFVESILVLPHPSGFLVRNAQFFY